MSHSSPFLERSARALRAREAKMRRRRRRRQLVAAVLTILVAGGAALALSRSSPTHGSASASRGTPSHGAAHTTPPLSPTGLPLGRPPLPLTLASTDEAGAGQAGAGGASGTTDDPVHVAFHRPPRAGLLFNLDSGRVLWQLNPLTHLHIASLTKMMTALRVVRSASPKDWVLVTKEAVSAAGSKVGVLPLGRHVRLKTMLYGLLLPSGNDAAMALAQHVSGSAPKFVEGMNQEAARLGMGCTHYTSPSGYVNARNYSCAADLAELAHVDLEQPLLAHIVRTEKAVLPFPVKGGKLYLYNNNPLLVYGYPGATGLKTGYTELAGECLVGTAERGGVRLGVVLLHSPELGRQAEYLLDRGFEDAYEQAPIAAPPVPAGR
jgi:D-alanyl-D-alanine carboxypeptidase (penicillin-binding protein 5/6)